MKPWVSFRCCCRRRISSFFRTGRRSLPANTWRGGEHPGFNFIEGFEKQPVDGRIHIWDGFPLEIIWGLFRFMAIGLQVILLDCLQSLFHAGDLSFFHNVRGKSLPVPSAEIIHVLQSLRVGVFPFLDFNFLGGLDEGDIGMTGEFFLSVLSGEQNQFFTGKVFHQEYRDIVDDAPVQDDPFTALHYREERWRARCLHEKIRQFVPGPALACQNRLAPETDLF